MRVILDVLEGPLKGRSFVFERHDTSYTYLGRYRKLVPGMLSEDFAVDNVGVADMGLVDELCSPNESGATSTRCRATGATFHPHRLEWQIAL